MRARAARLIVRNVEMRRRLLAILVVLSFEARARAGGFEIPANGTEAIGRGGAFTAKADDGTALEYNLAGLARQRGTRLLLDANLWLSDYSFQRAGRYPDDPGNSYTPWGGTAFPKVGDQGGPFLEPFVAASTDFGYFERWTFALGAFGPSSVGNRTFPYSLGFAPNPARYDIVQNQPQVIFGTAAAAVRALEWLDVGLAVHYVIANIDVATTTFSDAVAHGTAAGQCANVEYQPCDARSTLSTSGGAVTGSVGVMAHPTPYLAFGLNVRGPVELDTTGTVTTQAPRITPSAGFQPSPASLVVKLPAVAHLGGRYIFRKDDFEVGDVEIDGVYEGWGAAQGDGLHVSIPRLNATNPPPGVDLTNIDFISPHHYADTWGLRLGGAYNVRLGQGAGASVLTLRAGSYYDSSATDPAYTRLDFDTLTKVAGTLGAGIAMTRFTFNLGYAEIFDFGRTVTDGAVRPINGTQHGASTDSAGAPYPAVNDGTYSGHSRILSFGVTVRFDALFGRRRENASWL
jgi:hypothetical protein